MRDDILKVSGVSLEQRAAWSACAVAAGLPTAAWMREAAMAAAACGVTAVDLRAELVRLRAELTRGIGNNLNQVAHALNVDLKVGNCLDPAAHAASLAAAAADVEAARKMLNRMLRRLEQPKRRRAP